MADTRKDKRAPVSLKVRFKSATVDEFIEHYSKDVSRGGIYIKSSQPMSVGTLLKFQFQLKDESALIRGVGRVVWTRIEEDATADSPAGMGIKFIKMDNESRAMVERIVDSHAPEEGTYEVGRYGATSAEPTSSAPPPSEGGSFFPDLPPAVLPPPEDRTAVRQATQFLAAALTEGGTDASAAQEAQEKAEQARLRQDEVERERKLESEQKKQAEQQKREAVKERVSAVPPAPTPAARESATSPAPVAPAPTAPAAPVAREAAPVPRNSLPSMIIDPSLEPRAGRPSEESQGSDATPLPRTHPAILGARAAADAEEPDTEPPPPIVAAPRVPTTSIPQLLDTPRKSYLPYVVIAALAAIAAIAALRGAPEERSVASEELAAEQDESVREAKEPPAVVPVPADEAPPQPATAEPPVEEVATAPDAAAAAPVGDPTPAGVAAAKVSVEIATSPKGAAVFIGDEERGKSPLSVELLVDVPVEVRVRAPGYAELRHALTPGKKPSYLKLKLVEVPWVVHVESTPPGAAVNVGGHKGTTPVDLTLDDPPKGELSVNAKLEGYESARTRLSPSAFSESEGGMRATLSLTLGASLPAPTGKEATPATPQERPKKAPVAAKKPPPTAAATPTEPSPESKPADAKPTEVQPTEPKPVEAKPAEPKPADPTPAPKEVPDNPFGE